MKIKVQTQYTIFENPSSEEICKNTPMVKVYLKDGVISTFVRKNSREAAPGRFMKTTNAWFHLKPMK